MNSEQVYIDFIATRYWTVVKGNFRVHQIVGQSNRTPKEEKEAEPTMHRNLCFDRSNTQIPWMGCEGICNLDIGTYQTEIKL